MKFFGESHSLILLLLLRHLESPMHHAASTLHRAVTDTAVSLRCPVSLLTTSTITTTAATLGNAVLHELRPQVPSGVLSQVVVHLLQRSLKEVKFAFVELELLFDVLSIQFIESGVQLTDLDFIFCAVDSFQVGATLGSHVLFALYQHSKFSLGSEQSNK